MIPSPSAPLPLSGCAPLDHLCVVRASGADAVSFLQGQLTHDVAALPAGRARLAAYCNAKGRAQATLVAWRGPATADGHPTLLFLVDASLADALIKRLRMFVLRAKVVFERLDWAVDGVWSDTQPGLSPWQCQADDAGAPGLRIGAPVTAAGGWRAWQVSPGGHLPANASAADWRVQDIQAGLPWVTAATFELFTPLMVNFDLIDGVSFSKGCYPGQEVVARSHYRGKQKRRTHRASLLLPDGCDPGALPGLDICAPQAHEPVGRVVNAAATGGVLEILFEASLQAGAEPGLRLATADGPPIALQPLPYDLGAGSD